MPSVPPVCAKEGGSRLNPEITTTECAWRCAGEGGCGPNGTTSGYKVWAHHPCSGKPLEVRARRRHATTTRGAEKTKNLTRGKGGSRSNCVNLPVQRARRATTGREGGGPCTAWTNQASRAKKKGVRVRVTQNWGTLTRQSDEHAQSKSSCLGYLWRST